MDAISAGLYELMEPRNFISDRIFPPGPDYSPALIGYSQPKHPAIHAGIRFLTSRINRVIRSEKWPDEDEASYGSFGDPSIPLRHHALARLKDRLWSLANGWESQPIWDEAKRAKIKAEFDATHPQTITFYGVSREPRASRLLNLEREGD